MEFPLIFGETNFMKVPKVHEIYKIEVQPQKERPMIIYKQYSNCAGKLATYEYIYLSKYIHNFTLS